MRMASSSGSSCGLSPAWPSVSRIDSGRPRPSTARWIFVVSPPRDRPIASPSCVSTVARAGPKPVAPPFYGRQRHAGAPARSRSPHSGPSRPGGRRRRPEPGPGSGRTCRPRSTGVAVHGRSSTVRTARASPATAPRPQLPQDPVDDLPVVPPLTRARARRGQQWRDRRPRLVRQLTTTDHQGIVGHQPST
jgi:hypothetical protein